MSHPPTPTILLLFLPPSTLCGIDLLSFTTSPRFQGIKSLPPGWHFVFTGATASLSIRHGFWFHVPHASPSDPPTLLVRKWDPQKEELVPETDPAALMRYRANLGTLWREALTPYRQSAAAAAPRKATSAGRGEEVEEYGGAVVEEESADWALLTKHVTSALLGRLTGGGEDETGWGLTSVSCAVEDREEIPGLSSEEVEGVVGGEERELRFLGIDLSRTWREGAVGRERTEGAMDRSWALGEVVRRCQGGEWGGELLGEMEVCFLMVLTVGNYSCLEEWKRVLGLVLTCKKAVREREEWFAEVIGLLRRQLRRCEDVEGGLFDMSEEGGAYLKGLLKGFKRGLQEVFEEGEGEDIKAEMDELEMWLKKEYGWELSDSFVRKGMLELEDGEQVEMEMGELEGEDERGEYAPVVVELS